MNVNNVMGMVTDYKERERKRVRKYNLALFLLVLWNCMLTYYIVSFYIKINLLAIVSEYLYHVLVGLGALS